MTGSVALAILRADILGWWNRLTRPPRKWVRLTALALVLVVGFGGLMFGIFTGAVGLGRLFPAAADSALVAGFTSATLTMLLLGMPGIVGTFYVGRDVAMLVTAPIRPAEIFLAKTFTAAWTNVLLALAALDGVVGLGLGSRAPASYYLAGLAFTLSMPILATALQLSLAAAVVRFLPARQVRDVSAVLAGLSATALYIGGFGFRRNVIFAANGSSIASLQATLQSLDWSPTAWPAHSLFDLMHGDGIGALLWSLPWIALTAAVMLAAWYLYDRTIVAGIESLSDSAPVKVHARHSPSAGSASPLMAMAFKEWLQMRRDVRRLGRLAPALMIGLFYPFLFFNGGRSLAGNTNFFLAVSGTLFACYMFSFTLPLQSVVSEGRQILLLRSSPASMARLLGGKFAGLLAITGVGSVAVGVIGGVMRHGTPGEIAVWALFNLWCSAGMTAIATSAGALDPNFEAGDARRAVGIIGTFAAMGGTLVFMALSIAGFAAMAAAATVAQVQRFDPELVAGGVLAMAIAFAVPAFGLWFGAARLDRWEGRAVSN